MKYSAIIVLLAASLLSAQTGPNDARAREIYKELVEINTTDTPAGNVTVFRCMVRRTQQSAHFVSADKI